MSSALLFRSNRRIIFVDICVSRDRSNVNHNGESREHTKGRQGRERSCRKQVTLASQFFSCSEYWKLRLPTHIYIYFPDRNLTCYYSQRLTKHLVSFLEVSSYHHKTTFTHSIYTFYTKRTSVFSNCDPNDSEHRR